MVHQRQRLPLGLEPGDDLLGVHAQLDDLERDPAAHRLLLLGHVDHAAAAFADLLQQLVAAQSACPRAILGEVDPRAFALRWFQESASSSWARATFNVLRSAGSSAQARVQEGGALRACAAFSAPRKESLGQLRGFASSSSRTRIIRGADYGSSIQCAMRRPEHTRPEQSTRLRPDLI